jgi:hypothetical protein
MRTGRNDIAIQTIQSRPTGAEYAQYQYLDFMLGLAKLRKLDYSAAGDFEKFIRNYKGKNYIKEAYQKLAWLSLIKGEKDKYWENMYYVKSRGDDLIDDDKQALYEAESGKMPNVTLSIKLSSGIIPGVLPTANVEALNKMPAVTLPLYHRYAIGLGFCRFMLLR